MLSRTVEYALRAVVCLAHCAGKPATTELVAARTQVPAAYLAKILQGLSRAGLVRSQRGVGGGVALAADPATLTLLQIITAVEPLRRITDCPLGHSRGKLCPLHSEVDAAIAAVEAVFQRTTLADILSRDTEPFCAAPCAGDDTMKIMPSLTLNVRPKPAAPKLESESAVRL